MKHVVHPEKDVVKKTLHRYDHYWYRYRKPIVITTSVLVLQLLFGFDPKFCIINLIWLLV
jgi:hypothetical protein